MVVVVRIPLPQALATVLGTQSPIAITTTEYQKLTTCKLSPTPPSQVIPIVQEYMEGCGHDGLRLNTGGWSDYERNVKYKLYTGPNAGSFLSRGASSCAFDIVVQPLGWPVRGMGKQPLLRPEPMYYWNKIVSEFVFKTKLATRLVNQEMDVFCFPQLTKEKAGLCFEDGQGYPVNRGWLPSHVQVKGDVRWGPAVLY
eukprot:TRINITY_DN62301_c0_g1_i2.p1 TRINITY_DN62301_c0_g1~~TRINITY_DN62301_c0_g1_i2.p1  ORF type:complete len:198 (-),score=12.74 TRINITY_DN62301_c0_g1_i2:46-639(-)